MTTQLENQSPRQQEEHKRTLGNGGRRGNMAHFRIKKINAVGAEEPGGQLLERRWQGKHGLF